MVRVDLQVAAPRQLGLVAGPLDLLPEQALHLRQPGRHLLLDRERQGRRSEKVQHEQWQKTHQHTSRAASQKDARIAELESSRGSDRKKLATLEAQFRDQLAERNALLLTLWTRVSAACGQDWLHQNSLVNNHLPTLDVVGKGRFTVLTSLAGVAWEQAAAALGLAFVDVIVVGRPGVEDLYHAWHRCREIHEAGVLLVRPDAVVAWRHSGPVWDVAEATEKLRTAIDSVLSRVT